MPGSALACHTLLMHSYMLSHGAEGLVQLYVAPVEHKQLTGTSQELGFPSWNWDLAFPCTLKMNQNCCFVGNQDRAFHGEANTPHCPGFPKSKTYPGTLLGAVGARLTVLIPPGISHTRPSEGLKKLFPLLDAAEQRPVTLQPPFLPQEKHFSLSSTTTATSCSRAPSTFLTMDRVLIVQN